MGIVRNAKLRIVRILLMCATLLGAFAIVAAVALATGDGEDKRGAQSYRLGPAFSGAVVPPSIERDLEPVVVAGAALPHLADTPTDDLFVYAHRDGSLQQIPFQVDEVVSGAYTDTVGSPLDADDELVFMASDLGGQLLDEQLGATLPISSTSYEIEVSDPLRPPGQGWAYIVRSSSLTKTFTETYTAFDPVTNRITTTWYAVGFASDFPGLDYLSLNESGVDILDRTKIRVSTLFGTFNEEQIGSLLGSEPITAIKDGPVRVLAVGGIAGYRSTLEQSTAYTLPAWISLKSARFSTDFNEDATGSTFYNANTPLGVTIDGIPDTVGVDPLSPWWQASGATGTLVQAADSSAVGGTQTSYYLDDAETDPDDTGDQKSYGDVGISVVSPGRTIDYRTVLYVLPPDQENVGETYMDEFEHPLQVTARPLFQYRIYLPTVLRS